MTSTETVDLDADLIATSQRLRRIASTASATVTDQLLSAFRTTMDLDTKRDFHDIVTVHDRASEERIVEVLLEAEPDSVIIGEEGGRRGNGRVEWHIDPIDGTSNFARGIAYWCVSIGAVIDGRVVAGVISNPSTGDVFSADLSGAWLGDRPLRSAARPTEDTATIVSSFPNGKDLRLFGTDAMTAQQRLIDNFQAVRNLGSGALNLAHVAAGWADATMGFETNSWDISAGLLILEQAGGVFHGLAHGRPVPEQHLAPDYFAIGNGADYDTLRELMTDFSGRL